MSSDACEVPIGNLVIISTISIISYKYFFIKFYERDERNVVIRRFFSMLLAFSLNK